MKLQTPARVEIGRVLQAGYAVFAIAATGRSVFQLAVHGSEAPVPYSLSALAAVIYVAGFVALRRADRGGPALRTATVLCLVELAGVAAVGLFSALVPEGFPDNTVWSGFGSGYAYIPALLPIAALWWLKAERDLCARRTATPACDGIRSQDLRSHLPGG